MEDSLGLPGGDLRKIQSASSMLSEAATFYSVLGTLPKPADSGTGAEAEIETLPQETADSGLSVMTPTDPPKESPIFPPAVQPPSSHERPEILRDEQALLHQPSDKDPKASVPDQPRPRLSKRRSRTAPLPEPSGTRLSSSRRSSVTRGHANPIPDLQSPSQRPSSHRTSFFLAARSPRKSRMNRTSSCGSARLYTEDPYITHQRARELFPAPGSTATIIPPSVRDHREPLLYTGESAKSSLYRQHHTIGSSSSSYETLGPRVVEEPPCGQVVCTVIDWTAPATRRREYEKIDRSTRGVRGLWRKVSPCWLREGSRMQFYQGKDDDDARSVRRYRLDISDDEDEKQVSGRVQGRGLRPGLFRSKTGWSCFSANGGKGEKG